MAVPLIDLSAQHEALWPDLRDLFERVVSSGRFILGPYVDSFEKQLATYCGVRRAVGMSSGTDALLAALMALSIGPGDEVITTPFTFFATAGTIARTGARPVFVDIDPGTFNILPDAVAAAVTPRTKAIMPVHLYGLAAEMGPLMKIARKHHLRVIEDAAQAIGAKDGQAMAGSIGDVGCLSFYPTKNLSAMGDAGACTTNEPDLAQQLQVVRGHGQTSEYYHNLVGGNFRLDALQAAILSLKLPLLDRWTRQRREHARVYRHALSGLPITLPQEPQGKFHVYNQYTIRVPDGRRDDLAHHLAAHGVGHRVYYPVPLHLQPCFAALGYKAGAFPVAETATKEVLSLPIFPEMTAEQQNQVVAAVREFFQ